MRNQSLAAKLSLMLCMVLLCACSGIDNNHVPLGTWEDAAQQRYMSIEPDGEHYRAVLFSVFESQESGDNVSRTKTTVMRENTLSAKMKAGVLTLKASDDVEISVLYHPDGHLILVNGVTEFRRVPEALAQLTLAKLQNGAH